MSNYGHNETAVRLAALAGDAQIALDKVAKGEADTNDGWMAYGAALNEGRALFAEDKAFGKWIAENLSSNLEVHPAEQSAAMWAAANADQLSEAKSSCNARTPRGWHTQWKKIEQEREAARQEAEREAEAKRKREESGKARQEAEAAAKVEEEARAAAAAAETDEERQEAEAKAEEAAAAKVVAEKIVAAAAPEISPEPPVDPETAKARRELAKLTTEALIDEVIGLRADLADERAKRKSVIAERDDLKARLADHAADDKDEVIRRLRAAVKQAENAKWRATEEQGTAMKQVYALKKRVAELEAMGIAL